VGLLALSGCAVKEAEDGAAGGGGTTAGGGTGGTNAGGSSSGGTSAGGTSSGGSSTGGAAGSATADACNGVSTQGKCEGNKVVLCQQPPPGTTGEQPRLVTNDCGANYACSEDASGAVCKLKTACVPGENRCSGDNKAVEICKADGSGFAATACAAKESCTSIPGKAAACEAQPQAGGTGATDTLKGCISFERKGLTTTGPTAIAVEPAVLQFVAVYNGADYIGYGITGAADGCFEAELAAPATADTTVYVFAMDFDPATNQPLVAVAHYAGDDGSSLPKSSTEYWNWSNKQDGCGDGLKAAVVPNKDGPGKHVLGTVDHDADGVPDMLVPEVCGSGAIRIFQWTRFGMVRLGADHYGLETFLGADQKPRDIVKSTESLKQDSIAVYWEKGKDVACGACFSNKGNGPFHVDPAGEIDDLYDTAIYISGTEANPTQWSYSVLSHELGHWVMANYSQSPGEGGVHYVGQESKPGLAYSEGWATAFGQWNSSFAGDWDPVYIDVQDGTTFHVDIEKGTYSGGNLVRPKADAGIDQFINENVVAGMIFKLNADGSGVTRNITGGQGLGPDALFKAFISPRVKSSSGRGYARVDVVDFFDGGRCTEALPNANISAVSNEVTFPWDSTPKCN